MAQTDGYQTSTSRGNNMEEIELNGKGVSTGPKKDCPKMAETWPEMLRAWPKTTLCIVSNEFCERFSYYGMRTILTLYFMNVLKFDNDVSTLCFNGFTVLCYLTPLLGSILADGYIGKFRTVFFLSILYAMGQVLLALASTQQPGSKIHPWVDLLGLTIIGFGTGGIKPCVASFGGDQFDLYQEKMLSLFFSVFYFSINAGAMISTFISPMFRATPCLGQDSCYPLAFGIPAILMVLATVIFMSGSFWYKKPPPKENIFGEVYKLTKKAVANRCRRRSGQKYDHWLEYYFDSHNCKRDSNCLEMQRKKNNTTACHKRQFVDDVKGLLRLLVMYLPVPMFWALYDQQGSRWLIQSIQMDCRLWEGVMLLPDQMQTLNAILILLFIPFFQVIVYPLFSLCFKLTPLRKMAAGGLLAALAFVVSAAVQFRVNTTLPDLPANDHTLVSVMNAFDTCSLNVSVVGTEDSVVIMPNHTLTNNKVAKKLEMFDLLSGPTTFHLEFVNGTCESATGKPLTFTDVNYRTSAGKTSYLIVGPTGTLFAEASMEKPVQGTGEFSVGITLALEDYPYSGNLALCRKNTEGTTSEHPCDPRRTEDFYYWQIDDGDLVENLQMDQPFDDGAIAVNASIYTYKAVRPGKWQLYYMLNTPKKIGEQSMSKEQVLVNPTGVKFQIEGQGGVYMLAVTGTKNDAKKRVFQVVQDNRVSIIWQVPQIAIITAAEILFSITGYEFAYSQAAPSMKSLVQAFWLLTTALGDTIILVITLMKFSNMGVEFLFYAGMMVVVTGILVLLAVFYYEYNYYTEDATTSSVYADDDWDEGWAATVRKNSLTASASTKRRHFAQENGTDNHAFVKGDEKADNGSSWQRL